MHSTGQHLVLFDLSLEQIPTQRCQDILPGFHPADFNRNLMLLGQTNDLGCGLPGFFKGKIGRIHAVAVQTYCDAGRYSNQMFQNCHMLPGQIGKSVYVKYMICAKAAFFQLLQKPVHLIPGIPLSSCTKAVIGFQQKGQFLQLLGKRTFGSLGSRLQISCGDTAALKFIHSIH